ncbi:hypothetical protein [Pontibacter ruber]|uniref:DUF5050 domain-containing protein n=1 Tax=Pontibacter ruber TaxID=1343895 RepID=A0ABW5CXQ7_9BACT|nr:hypothetical protein [Pontibacter ruber]
MKPSLYVSLLLLPLVLLAAPVFAQQQQLTYRRSFATSSPSTISIDRNGSVYFLDTRRNLTKLDSLGQPVSNFSPPSRGRISAVEVWNPMKLFLFYEDRQELLLLDRFLRPIGSTRLADYNYTGNIRAATLASDDSFWLFNETDFSLSKIDIRYQKPIVETPLDLVLDKARFDVRFMREYQNMLYLLDANGGVYVFDNLGNYKKKLPFTGLSYIGFRGNELYFVKEGKLHFFDLYKLQERTLDLPRNKAYVSALVGDNNIFLFTKNEVDLYTLE